MLSERSTEIADRWVRLQTARTGLREDLAEGELREEADVLVRTLSTALAGGLPAEEVVDRHTELREAVVDLSLRRARGGTSPTATSLAVLQLKEVLLEALQREDMGREEMFAAAVLVNRLMDAAGALSFATFVEGREEIIRRQSRQLLEISTPVVRLWRQVLAVPLIGNLDTARSQVVMENLLQAIQDEEARVAIIDITGVPTVDTSVAQHLMQTVKAVPRWRPRHQRPPAGHRADHRPARHRPVGDSSRATLSDALEAAIKLREQSAEVRGTARD